MFDWCHVFQSLWVICLKKKKNKTKGIFLINFHQVRAFVRFHLMDINKSTTMLLNEFPIFIFVCSTCKYFVFIFFCYSFSNLKCIKMYFERTRKVTRKKIFFLFWFFFAFVGFVFCDDFKLQIICHQCSYQYHVQSHHDFNISHDETNWTLGKFCFRLFLFL